MAEAAGLDHRTPAAGRASGSHEAAVDSSGHAASAVREVDREHRRWAAGPGEDTEADPQLLEVASRRDACEGMPCAQGRMPVLGTTLA